MQLVDRLSRRGAVSRRGLLVGAAVAGSALATDPKAYALLPQTAYATICGPGNTASSGWTIFCATVNKGVNGCPPGSFTAGWWKAADSSWCGGGYRYIVDCNAKCTKCSTGCSDHICDSKCWNCSCTRGSTATCDQRVNCCNAFRYGQCNTQVKCSGGVHCRVVSCVAPYKWDNCSTTSFRSDSTAEHSSPYLPAWGPMEQLYTAMGAQRSYLRASTGPIRTTDGRHREVRQLHRAAGSGGPARPAPRRCPSSSLERVRRVRRPCAAGLPQGGAHHGAHRRRAGSSSSRTGPWSTARRPPRHSVHGYRWVDVARQRSRDRPAAVPRRPRWSTSRRLDPALPERLHRRQHRRPRGPSCTLRLGGLGRGRARAGPARLPDRRPGRSWPAATTQPFQGRRAVGARAARPVYRGAGARCSTPWLAAGGADGGYGFPTAHVVDNGDGTLTGAFEGGTITV